MWEPVVVFLGLPLILLCVIIIQEVRYRLKPKGVRYLLNKVRRNYDER